MPWGGMMASYHCTVRVGLKGKGASATAHAAYIIRAGKYAARDDVVAIGSLNMPAWAAHNPEIFWMASDAHERDNGSTYREFELALPRELSLAQRIELVEDFITSALGGRHATQWAIHCPAAALEGGEQPHAHIMYSERRLDGIARDPGQFFKRWNGKRPENGGCQKDSAGTEDRLLVTRKLWADIQNAHLARHGHDTRVDHRSLIDQGRHDELPEFHLGHHLYDLADDQITALMNMRAVRSDLRSAKSSLATVFEETGIWDLESLDYVRLAERARQRQAKFKIERAEQERIMCEQREQIASLKWQQAEIESRHQAERARLMTAFNAAQHAERMAWACEIVEAGKDFEHGEILRCEVEDAEAQIAEAQQAIKALVERAKAWRRAHPIRALFGISIAPLKAMGKELTALYEKQEAAEEELAAAIKAHQAQLLVTNQRRGRQAEIEGRTAELDRQLNAISLAVVGTEAERQRIHEIAAEIERLQLLQDECIRRNGGVCDDGDGDMDVALALKPEPRRKKRLVIEYLAVNGDSEREARGYAITQALRSVEAGPVSRFEQQVCLVTDRDPSEPEFKFARMRLFGNQVPANPEPERRHRIEIDISEAAQDEASLHAYITCELEALRDECVPRPTPKRRRKKLENDDASPSPF